MTRSDARGRGGGGTVGVVDESTDSHLLLARLGDCARYDPLPQHFVPTPLGRAMTTQPWADVGLPPSSSSACSGGEGAGGVDEQDSSSDSANATIATSDFEKTVEQLSSILESRLADVILERRRRRRRPELSEEDEGSSRCGSQYSSGASVSAVSRTSSGGWSVGDEVEGAIVLSPAVRSELRQYVAVIGSMYRDCKYHKFEHAAHVTASANKLLDMMEERDLSAFHESNGDLNNGGSEEGGDESPPGPNGGAGDEMGLFGGGGDTHPGVPTVHIDHPKLGEVVRRMSDMASRKSSMDSCATMLTAPSQTQYGRRRSSMATAATEQDQANVNGGSGGQAGPANEQTPMCYFEMPSHYSPNTAVSTPEPHVVLRGDPLSDRLARGRPRSSTYGIDSDPLAKFALVYAALVHDVDHQGVPNRQLVAEGDDLAFLYNDKSIAEQHSLKVAFQTLMKPRFASLRHELIPTSGDQFRFRRLVIELVLCTDIASPERMQLTKSKWNEAFGELAPVGLPDVASSNSSAAAGTGGGDDGKVATVTASRPVVCPAVQRKVRRRASVGVPGYAPSFYPAQGGGGFSHPWGAGGAGAGSGSSSHASSNSSQGGIVGMGVGCHSIGGECLGIRRALHMNGSTIEFYAAPGSAEGRNHHNGHNKDPHYDGAEAQADAQERLRAAVVLETAMNAADVAHTLQSFDNFVKWNRRLYEELYAAYRTGRVQSGETDPADDWYGNQLTFYDIYILPLAAKLRACGAFGRGGEEFLKNAAEVRRRWSEEGMGVTCRIVCEVHAEWAERERKEAAAAEAEGNEASAVDAVASSKGHRSTSAPEVLKC